MLIYVEVKSENYAFISTLVTKLFMCGCDRWRENI